MKIFSDLDSTDEESIGFEVDSAYIGISGITRLLERLPGVEKVVRRAPFQKWGDVRVRFTYHDIDFVVIEPFGDNSRYWIGPVEGGQVDTRELKGSFQEHDPAWPRKLLATLLGVEWPSSSLERLGRKKSR